ncbi:MAG: hypothetical protein R2706_16405 [Acidimicrobiales bacterium]
MRLFAAFSGGVFIYLTIGSLVGVTPKFLRRSSPNRRTAARIQDWLNQAGVAVSPVQFVVTSIAAGLVVGLLAAAFSGATPIGLAAGLATLSLPRSVYARKVRDEKRKRLTAWPDAIRDVVAHLRASLSIHASLCELGRSGPEPLRLAFTRYERLAAALDHKAALEVVREELADPLSDRIIEILLVAYDQGATVIVEILEDLAETSARDLRLIEEIDTAQLETKLEARGAAALPLAVLALLCSSTPGYRAFYSSAGGWFVIGLGCAMSMLGLVVIERLGKQPTEVRILAAGGEI